MVNKEKIREYLLQEVTIKEIDDNTLIFRQGLLDSMGFMLLITFLEEEFKIKIIDKDMIEENFESIDAIIKYIESK